MDKYVYLFKDGNKDMTSVLGGKGANLAEMMSLGLPVPNGFTVSTLACQKYYENNKTLPQEIIEEIYKTIESLEKETKKQFGNKNNPLLVSVRSGARVSMPGMMDTILNLGLNDDIAKSLLAKTKNKRFVYDSYRRLILMYADVVKGYERNMFERFLDDYKQKLNYQSDLDLDGDDMEFITKHFKEIYKSMAGEDFPSDPREQLINAIGAVFKSWNNERAIYYRKLNNIPSEWGTAVNVQEMVYGNIGTNSGTGVAFTRNPATGENKLFGEYLMNAQGEDVVAGIRTPENIDKLKTDMPLIYEEFSDIAKKLESHYKDMQDMEFTIENGKLYMLQTRSGKRTSKACVKIALDLYKEKMITKEEAIMRVEPERLEDLLHKSFRIEDLKEHTPITKGLAASPGAATGTIYFDATKTIKHHKNGEKVILVRLETSPEDIEGMHHAEGVLTVRGGMTSHAAVVARGMGVCCVSGCSDIIIDEENKCLKIGNITVREGEQLSLDGTTGNVYLGSIALEPPVISGDFKEFMQLVSSIKTMGVRANADNARDAKMAYDFGAEGIGLCRTEHMFFEKERIFHFRQMILADTLEEREKALNYILPYQESDFLSLYKIMSGKPVVVRYLDPPLHEFLPKEESEIESLAKSLNKSTEDIIDKIAYLKEFNPMMGHRGCRLLITYPEICVMQTKALIGATIKARGEGINVTPEIMIPLVGSVSEFTYLKDIVTKTADAMLKEANLKIKYLIGTMIEVPRATLIADEIAKHADFFSFGTNDLTQMTFGFSRDDAGKFLTDYYDKGILSSDPFKSIDEVGVGSLVKLAIDKGTSMNPFLSLGVCGEHGGDPKSITFFNEIGLDYVSCSPYRVPIAALAAARSAIKSCDRK